MTTLTDIMGALYSSEINCGMQSFWDGGFDVWIGDELNGKREISSGYYPSMFSEAMNWLHDAALRHYPNSAYAVLHKDERP